MDRRGRGWLRLKRVSRLKASSQEGESFQTMLLAVAVIVLGVIIALLLTNASANSTSLFQSHNPLQRRVQATETTPSNRAPASVAGFAMSRNGSGGGVGAVQQQLNNHEAMFRSLAMPGLSYANAFESYAPPIHQHLSPNYFTNNGNHFIAHHGPSASDVMLARSGLDMTQNNGTPQQSSNNDYAAPKISGMTPLVFSTTAGVLANQMPAFHPNNAAAAMRNAMNAEATNN